MIYNFKDFEEVNEGLFSTPVKTFIKYANNYIFSKDIKTPFIELYPEFKPISSFSDITATKIDKHTVKLDSGIKGEYRPEPYQNASELSKKINQSIKIRMTKLVKDFLLEYPEYDATFEMMDQTVTITKK